MPISVEWLVKDRVILSTLTDKVTAREVDAWLEDRKYMVDMGIPLVHHITDICQLDLTRLDSGVLEKLSHAMPQNPNVGCQIEVTSHKALADTEMRIFSSVDSALEFLHQQDETLAETFWQRVSNT